MTQLPTRGIRAWPGPVKFKCSSLLTHKQLETHECVLSTVATDVLVLKHQAISIHGAELIVIVLQQFHADLLEL